MLFFKKPKGQVTLNFIFAFFAAVVILGALFKIRHWPYADEMITLGLLSEVIVFLVMAFLVPPPEEPHWQRYFPDINKHPDLVDKMSDITDVVAATGDYTAKTREASVALTTMKDAYLGAAGSIQHFTAAADGTKQFHEQVQVLTKNLGSLNTIYELELQDTNNHLKAMNKYYSNLVNASQAMEGSVDDAKKAHDQIAVLANNLGRLNNIYGNMLSAMQGRA